MASLIDRLARLFRANTSGGRGILGGFTDSLLQTFENSRGGLDDADAADDEKAAAFFEEIFEGERPRLGEMCSGRETGLAGAEQATFRRNVEGYFRKVVLPAYIRIAQRFTVRERNGFYLVPDAWHGAERMAWAVGGMAIGAFVIWAPFIPVWEKEWVAVFALGGLVFPELRRYLAYRRYQSEVNRIVTRANDEIFRLDMALVERMATRTAEGDEDAVLLACEDEQNVLAPLVNVTNAATDEKAGARGGRNSRRRERER